MNTTYSEFITHLRSLSCASMVIFDGYSGLGYANSALVQGTLMVPMNSLWEYSQRHSDGATHEH